MSVALTGLKQGSIIDLIAPGFRFDRKALEASCELIRSWGFVPRAPSGLMGRDVICASPLSRRREHLLKALKAPDSEAVWAVRGGYGCLQLLPHLPKRPPKGRAKWVIGYSDVTSLHHFLLDQWGWPSLHAPLAETLTTQKIRAQDLRALKNILQGQLTELQVPGLRPANLAAQKRLQSVRGVLTGGNLTVVQSSMGTPFQCRGEGRVVFFEEVGERGYRVDRALQQLSLSGFFKGVRAVVAGEFLGGAETDGKVLGPKVFKEWASMQRFPVFTGLPAGHGAKQVPLVVGASAVLKKEGTKWQLQYRVPR